MTGVKMMQSGELAKSHEAGGYLSDIELSEVIDATYLTLAYLDGRGQRFSLAADALRLDHQQYLLCQENRRGR
jgi:hypothetical protein